MLRFVGLFFGCYFFDVDSRSRVDAIWRRPGGNASSHELRSGLTRPVTTSWQSSIEPRDLLLGPQLVVFIAKGHK